MFNKDSQIVKVWLRLLAENTFAKEQIPQLFNLRELIYQMLGETSTVDIDV